MSTATLSDVTPPRHPPVGGHRRWNGPLLVLPWLAAAWLLPVATHSLGVDPVLVVIVVAGLVSLQRGGRGLVDRLVLAVVQLFGALCVAGLVFSVWPWHLHPVAMGGTALTALVLLAVSTRRRPAAPERIRPADRLVLLATLSLGLLAVEPFALRDLGGRIGILMPGEDMARHFLLVDAIGRVGGYAFLHPHEFAAFIPPAYASGIGNYPQGTFFGYAVLDRFLRSASSNADGVTGINVMIWCYVATFVFLALATLWALRRVAGPGRGAGALLPVLAGAALYLYFGDPVAVFTRGYPGELTGLALVAVLTALLVRPLPRTGEQIVTVALLLVGVAFTYHLFLPYAVVAAAVWAWRDRYRLLRRWRALLLGFALLPFALVVPVLNLYVVSSGLLVSKGTALPTDRPATVVLLAVAAAGLVLRGGLRSPVRQMTALLLLAAVAEVAALLIYQYALIGHTIYYFEKTVHLLQIVALVGLGALVRLAPRLPARAEVGRVGQARRLAPVAVLLLVTSAAMVGLGGPTHTSLGSHGLRLASGVEKGSPQGGRDAILMSRRYPDGGGKINVSLMHAPYANFLGTYFASTMQRNFRDIGGWYGFLNPVDRPRTLADLEQMVRASDVDMRFFVQDPQASFLVIDPEHPNRPATHGSFPVAYGDPAAPTNLEAVQYLAAKYPDRVEVVVVAPGAVR